MTKNASRIAVAVSFIEQANDDATILESFAKVAEEVNDDCVITSCDLIFEYNPFPHLKKNYDIELLIHKHNHEQKFCGASIQVKTNLLGGLSDIGHQLEDFNAWHTGIYWFSKHGLQRLHTVLKAASPYSTVPDVLKALHNEEPLQLTKMRDMQWFDINATDTLMRAEMLMRRKNVSELPTRVDVQALQKKEPPLFFWHERKAKTNIIIEPGLMNHFTDYEIMPPNYTASQHILITDDNVNELFGNQVHARMLKAGYAVKKFIVPDRDAAKTMNVYNTIAEEIIALGIDEHSIIFALGGGAVANISGFLASTLYRGIGLIHIPTTVLNMLDVSVSLKQGINGQKGKNLVGSWYQPLLVLIDPAISIPDWRVQDGLSEGIKHALCQDKVFFDYLLQYNGSMSDVGFRTVAIEKTIQLKTELMDEDIHENHQGMILNYGHEVGHALEFLSHFDLTHGQAIAIGMRVSAELAHVMGVTGQETVDAHHAIFKHFDLPYSIPVYIKKEAIMDALVYNKKNKGKELCFVLLEFVGKVWKVKGEYAIPCPVELIEKAIENSYEK